MRVIVIGAGGVGGWILRAVAPTLQYHQSLQDRSREIIIVDGDTFEPKNAERQDFLHGGSKVNSRAEELSERYPDVNFYPLPVWVVEESSDEMFDPKAKTIAADNLLSNGDFVFCVVDNFATRMIVADAASRLNEIDLIIAGNDEGYAATMYHYQRRNNQDVTLNPLWKDEFKNPADRNPGELSCEERAMIDGGTQLIWTNMGVAALAGAKMMKVAFDEERVPSTDEVFLDLDLGVANGHDRGVDAFSGTMSVTAEAETSLETVS